MKNMSETKQLNTSWLVELTNPHHDGTTQQIDDFATAFVTDNARFIERRQALHQCRQAEDAAWIKSQRDPAVKRLEEANKRMDGFVSCARYIIIAHTNLPDGEPTKEEAKECEQVFKDCKFSTNDAYGAESDKIIQMEQNLRLHLAFLTQIGSWTYYTKAVEAARLVREILGERALTLGEAVKGEMRTARRATDTAIASLYKTVEAMMDLMPTPELTALYNQLKGIELYARKYYIKEGSSSGSSGNSGSTGSTGDSSDSGSTGDSGTDTPGTDQGGVGTIETGDGGTTPGTNTGTDTGDTGGTGTIDTGDTGDTGGDNGGGTTPDPNDPPIQDE